MASLALTSLITDFFYTGPSAFGKLFPEVFAQEALKSIVCLAVTPVSICFCYVLENFQPVHGHASQD